MNQFSWGHGSIFPERLLQGCFDPWPTCCHYDCNAVPPWENPHEEEPFRDAQITSGERLWEEKKCPGLRSRLLLSHLTFRRAADGEDLMLILMKASGFLGHYFWNLLRGLANRSSLLFRLVQKALITPQEIQDPAERVILVLALCFSLCL